jgi:acetyl-CoA C-acetyltransferase
LPGQTRDAAIVGIYEHPLRRMTDGLSNLQIKAECAARALEDAGLKWTDVDAIYDAGDGLNGIPGLTLAEYFGLHPRVIETTMVGGSSYEVHAAHARRDIAAGRAKVALLTYAQTQVSGPPSASRSGGPGEPVANMEDPYGATLIATYAFAAMRHMYQYGTKPEDLAEIAVATRAHAMRNPDAVKAMEDLRFKDIREITVEDVLNSRMIADPLHLLDCCMLSDGAGAVVIASPEVARDTRHRPAWIIGSGEATRYRDNEGDVTVSAAAESGPAAFGEAGIRPDEIDIAMLYDSFTITVMMILEDLGFCGKGDGGAFVRGGRLRWDTPGGPALNTDGGGLSSNHPGMRGIFLLIEAVRQLRRQSCSQVPGARLAVASGNGGLLGSRHVAGTVILAGD